VIDAKENVTVTMPLYRWLMLIGALANLPDQSWWDALVDQVLTVVGP
jgi:hypothetical protein